MSGKTGPKDQWQALNIYLLVELRLSGGKKEIVEYVIAICCDKIILVQLSEKLGAEGVHI